MCFHAGAGDWASDETTVGDTSPPNDHSNGTVFVWYKVLHLSALGYYSHQYELDSGCLCFLMYENCLFISMLLQWKETNWF